MHQASILMTFLVGLMGAVWYCVETGTFGDASTKAVAAVEDEDTGQPVRFNAKVDASALAD